MKVASYLSHWLLFMQFLLKTTLFIRYGVLSVSSQTTLKIVNDPTRLYLPASHNKQEILGHNNELTILLV